VGLILLVAAMLKAHQLATTPSLGEGLLHARWFNILVVEVELLFGLWLFFGLLSRLTWFATIGCFSMFALVSFYKAFSGEDSCGCFGLVKINPWITTLLDLVIVGFSLVFRPSEIVFSWRMFFQEFKTLKFGKRFWIITGIVIIVYFSCVICDIFVTKNKLVELGTEFIGIDGKKTILLEPEKWVGKEFPLLPYIEPVEIREKLKNGKWIVVLYHHNCTKCKEVIDELIKNKTENLVCVEIPPFSGKFCGARLIDVQSWIVESPVVVCLVNNQIVYINYSQ
jgi:hypothetical protein